ncbi:hypothetical protein C8A06_1334 [Microbacteriaceae bacterium MWH-Ta3]|jgi:hypothetical protein|nr:hypothetical protein C8A06_1334 [Microbacteriaceae bacterium MWH-Ta3]
MGAGRLLVIGYIVLALASTGRSIYQILTKFDVAPLAYSLSALSAAVYIVATIALARPGARWRTIAVTTIVFELVGVLVVGALSIVDPALFPADTVWSRFGMGYVFIPLALPIVGLVWLSRGRIRA